MKDGGYFKLYRRAFRDADHGGDPLWLEKRVWSRAEAWLYLLSIAAYGPHDKPLKGGRLVRLERGEFFASLRYLAKKWSWSKDKVARFLSLLESQMARIARQRRDSDGDTYLVVNYERYQGDRDTERGEGETPARHRRDTGETKDKKEEEGRRREEKKNTAASPEDGAAQPAPLLIFPCTGSPGKPREWSLTPEYAAELASAYDGLDVLAEARKSLAWIKANPTKKKTAKGMPAFLVNWLNSAVNRGSRSANGSLFPVQTPARFAARRADSSEASGSTVTKPKGWS